MNIKADLVIFDCDGVLIDSEWAHQQARRELAGTYGLSEAACAPNKPGYSCWAFWADYIEDPDTVQRVTAKQFDNALQLIVHAEKALPPGLTDLLDALKASSVTTAVASGSSSAFVHGFLEHYQLNGYFDAVLCSEHVRRLKPAPDIFNHCMAKLGITPQRTVVIEDSDSGCRAAKAAQCRCLAYSRYSSDTETYREADAVFDAMDQIAACLKDMHILNAFDVSGQHVRANQCAMQEE